MYPNNPFLWALVSMFGLVGACAVVGTKKVGRNAFLGLIIVTIFDLGRFLLVSPEQASFEIGGLFLACRYSLWPRRHKDTKRKGIEKVRSCEERNLPSYLLIFLFSPFFLNLRAFVPSWQN